MKSETTAANHCHLSGVLVLFEDCSDLALHLPDLIGTSAEILKIDDRKAAGGNWVTNFCVWHGAIIRRKTQLWNEQGCSPPPLQTPATDTGDPVCCVVFGR